MLYISSILLAFSHTTPSTIDFSSYIASLKHTARLIDDGFLSQVLLL